MRLAVGAVLACAAVPPEGAAAPAGLAEILAASPAADWRAIDPEDTLYLTLPQGRVVIELAPAFAPNHVANIKRLVRAGFYDGLAVVRVQDNYVVQWGDAQSTPPIAPMAPPTLSLLSPIRTPTRRGPVSPVTSPPRATRPRAGPG
jgi:hypothetical protein